MRNRRPASAGRLESSLSLAEQESSPYPLRVTGEASFCNESEGWVRLEIGDLTVLCRPEFAAPLSSVYLNHSWAYDALMMDPLATRLRGRKPVVAGLLAGSPVVVKRLHHGGFFAALTRDAFLTCARVRAHIENARYLNERGIRTPGIAFVAWRRVHGFVRCEVASYMVPGAIDADRYFFAPGGLPIDWKEHTTSIGRLVARMHRVGFLHPDLNLMNFLIAQSGDTYILDLDKTRPHHGPISAGARSANLARLERSIRKQGRDADTGTVDRLVTSVRSSYRQAVGAVLVLVGSVLLERGHGQAFIEQLALI